jgi:hypothetical protein
MIEKNYKINITITIIMLAMFSLPILFEQFLLNKK